MKAGTTQTPTKISTALSRVVSRIPVASYVGAGPLQANGKPAFISGAALQRPGSAGYFPNPSVRPCGTGSNFAASNLSSSQVPSRHLGLGGFSRVVFAVPYCDLLEPRNTDEDQPGTGHEHYTELHGEYICPYWDEFLQKRVFDLPGRFAGAKMIEIR